MHHAGQIACPRDTGMQGEALYGAPCPRVLGIERMFPAAAPGRTPVYFICIISNAYAGLTAMGGSHFLQ